MKIKKSLIIFLLCLFAFFLTRQFIELAWIQFRDSTDSNYAKEVQSAWSNKSTSFLMTKLGHPSYVFDGAAVVNLAKRRLSPNEIDKLKRDIRQNQRSRKGASSLNVLFAVDEKEAALIALNIVREGENNPLFRDALLQLSHAKNPEGFSYLLEYAKKPNGYNNGSVNMLKEYGRPEAIPILEDMLNKINEKDSFVRSLLKDTILEAIKTLKNQ